MIKKITEGAPAVYVRAAINENDFFVVTVGNMPLMASRPYSHRGDENYKGIFSCGFSSEWKTGVSDAMLWKFKKSENDESKFRLYSVGMKKYLSAFGEFTEDGNEKCTIDFDGEGTEFHLTNEGWIAFSVNGAENETEKETETEFYLSYLSGRGFHCPSGWTSSMTGMSDAEFYIASFVSDGELCCVSVAKHQNEVIVRDGMKEISDGEKVAAGTFLQVCAETDGEKLYTGYYVYGKFHRNTEKFCLCRDAEIVPVIRSGKEKYLSFISDVHDLPCRLETWLSALPEEITLQRCVFGGDITAGNVKSIAAQQEAHFRIGEVVKKYTREAPVITIGNHECEYDYRWSTGDVERRAEDIFKDSLRYGAFYDPDYEIYNLGAGEFDHNDFQSNFPSEAVDEMEKFLSAQPTDRPVFINAHYPLHAIKTRPEPNGAERVIDILNRYPNAVYFWGHNHGQHLETGYGRILSAGDEILYNFKTGARKTLNFTYASHGAMYDAARTVAPYYGLVAKISDGSVELTYYDMSGEAVPYKTANGIGEKTFKLKI